MKLTLTRFDFQEDRTLGRIDLGDSRLFWTLEDKMREEPGIPVDMWKVYGKTAIPCGSYKTIVDWSKRFKKELPRLLDVPGFSGIRIHSGNTPNDTEGCILVGKSLSQDGMEIRDSRAAMGELLSLLDGAFAAGQEIEIEVVNGPRA